MYMAKGSLVIIFLVSLFLFPNDFEAELQDTKLFKGSIETVNQMIEWKYESPKTNEYFIQEQRFIGKRAEKEINHLFNIISLSKHSNVEDIIHILEENGYNSITHIDISWMNSDDELYTWVWDKN